MTWGMVGGAAVATIGGGLLGGGGGGQTVDKRPWEEMIPYLLNDQGIFPQAQKQFTDMQGKWDTQYQPTVDAYTKQLQDRGNSSIFGGANQLAQNMMGGQFDYTAKPVQSLDANTGQAAGVSSLQASPWVEGSANPLSITSQNIRAPQISQPNQLQSQQVSLAQARGAQGPADPTQALSSLLSGKINNPYLQQQANAITGDITRNLKENILPSMRDTAVASGQYGGSRQGILEGKALSNVSRDTAGALSGLFGGAYENAQNRMQSTAGQLNDQAGNIAVNNAGRADNASQFNIGNQMDVNKFNAGNLIDQQKFNSSQMQTAETNNVSNMLQNQQFNVNNANSNINRNLDVNKFNTTSGINQNQFNAGQQSNTAQFNANLGFQNNAQQQNFGQQNLQNRTNALGLFGQAGGLQDQNFQSLFNTLGAQDKYKQNNLNNYSNIVMQGAGMGGSQSAPQADMASQMFGGALAGGQLYNLWNQNSGGSGFSGQPSNMNQMLQMNGNDYGKLLSGMGG